MKQSPKELSLLSQLLFYSYILFFISLVFSFRAVSSISTGLLILWGILYTKQQTGAIFHKNLVNLFYIACIIYFLFLLISFFFTQYSAEAWRQILLKSGLILVPLAVCCSGYINSSSRKKLLFAYSVILTAACLFCIGMAISHFIRTGDDSHFFYHTLVSPLRQHAVYFSILIFFAILFLLESAKSRQWLFHPVVHFNILAFFAFFLILLSSKLVIAFWGIYLLYYFATIGHLAKRSKAAVTLSALVVIVTGMLIFTTHNPVSSRFKDIFQGNLSLFNKDKYHPQDYFNGLQFRLLQWKLVPEILNDQQSWWTGVGPANSQTILAQKYIARNMYSGNTGSADKGYLLYNSHNQFLESLLKNGVPGAMCVLLMFLALLRIAWLKKRRLLTFTVLLLLLYSLTEAVLETQYGLLIFIFFPLFFSQD